MYLVTNTSMDRTKVFQHRKASKLEMEPLVGGTRLRLRESTTLADWQYEANKVYLDQQVANGSIFMVRISSEAAEPLPQEKQAETPPALPATPSDEGLEVAPPSPPVEEVQPASTTQSSKKGKRLV